MKNFLKNTLWVCVSISIIFLSRSSACGQDKDEDKGRQNFFLMRQLQSLANNQKLKKELEVSDDQLEEMKEVMANYQSSTRSGKLAEIGKEYGEIRRKNPKDKRLEALGKKWGEEIRVLQDKAFERVEEIFLPFQLDRIRQVAKQQNIRRTKRSDYFGIPLSLAGDIELSSSKKEKLEKLTNKVRQEYFEEIEQLRKKKMQTILKSLSSKDRKQIEELVGDLFDFESADREVSAARRKERAEAAQKKKTK